MADVSQVECITFEEVRYELGAPVCPTPDAMLSLAALGVLVAARRENNERELATAVLPVYNKPYPRAPEELQAEATPDERELHRAATADYRRDVKNHRAACAAGGTIEVPMPPLVGHIRATPLNLAFFAIQPLGSVTSTVFSYGDPGHRLQIATIVE